MKGYPLVLALLTVLVCSCDKDEITSIQSDSFVKYYALNRSNEGTCVCVIPGGGYALLGNSETDMRGSEVYLLLTDAFGNSIQEPKHYGKTGNDHGYCIKSAPGEGFVILGSTQDSINRDLEVWLIRTDALGDTLWTKTFTEFDEENGDDEGLWFDFNSKGEITMVGYVYKTVVTDDGPHYSKQIWIYDVDPDGNRIDNHEPITPGGKSDVDEARFIKCIDGDDFLISGVSNITNNTHATSYSYMTHLKSSYSSDLYYTESNIYMPEEDTSTLRDEANCLIPVDHNTLYLCGSRVRTTGIQEAYLCKFNKIFTDENKFDPKKDTIWYYNNAGSSKATHMLMDANNVYLLSTVTSGTDKSSTISIITTGLEGNNPVYMTLGGSSKMESRNFSFTTDGGFIISGTNKNKDISDISSMILIKTKAGGAL
jgi:hypothetical protein